MVTSGGELGETSSQPLKAAHVKPDTRHTNSCDLEAQKKDRNFRRTWYQATDDNQLTLFGFRRFRTAHLISLRFLEAEIDQVDHQIFQAGLSLGVRPGESDRLGLRQARRDPNLKAGCSISHGLISKLRELLKQYGMSIQPAGKCPS